MTVPRAKSSIAQARGPHHTALQLYPIISRPCGAMQPVHRLGRTGVSEVRLSLDLAPGESATSDRSRLLQRPGAQHACTAQRCLRCALAAKSNPRVPCHGDSRAPPECTIDRQCGVTQNRARGLTCGTRAVVPVATSRPFRFQVRLPAQRDGSKAQRLKGSKIMPMPTRRARAAPLCRRVSAACFRRGQRAFDTGRTLPVGTVHAGQNLLWHLRRRVVL